MDGAVAAGVPPGRELTSWSGGKKLAKAPNPIRMCVVPTHATSTTYFFVTDQRCVDRTLAALPDTTASSATSAVKKLSWVRRKR